MIIELQRKKKTLKGLSGINQKTKTKRLLSRVFWSYQIITSVNVITIQPEKDILFINCKMHGFAVIVL